MATPGGQQINLTPVYIEDRESLLRENVSFSSRIDSSVDFNSKLNEVVALCASQGNPAAGHVEEFISASASNKGAQARGLHDQLLGHHQGVRSENESLAINNDDLVRQNQKLVEYVKEFQAWQQNVYWQLDKYKGQQGELEGLRIKVRELQNNEGNYLKEIQSLRMQLGQEQHKSNGLNVDLNGFKTKHGEVVSQNRYLDGQLIDHKQTISEQQQRLLEIELLKSENAKLLYNFKIQSDEWQIKWRNLEMVNASLTNNVRDLNIQLQDYHIVRQEHDQLKTYLKEENDRVIMKAKATLSTGYSESKIKPSQYVVKAKIGEALNQSIYSNFVPDLNVSRANNLVYSQQAAPIQEKVIVEEIVTPGVQTVQTETFKDYSTYGTTKF